MRRPLAIMTTRIAPAPSADMQIRNSLNCSAADLTYAKPDRLTREHRDLKQRVFHKELSECCRKALRIAYETKGVCAACLALRQS